MKLSNVRKVLSGLFVVGVVIGTGVCLAQVVDEVWVKRPIVQIRAGKGAAYDVVATVKKGEMLVVIAREEKWLKVRAGAVEGYVFEEAISSKQVSSGEGLGALAGGSETSGLSTASAGKGLDRQAEEYAKQKNMNPKILEQMIKRRKSVTGADWEAFVKEGNVGPDHR